MQIPFRKIWRRLFPKRYLTGTERQVLLIIYDNAGETRNADVTIRWLVAAVFFPLLTAVLIFAVIPNILEGRFLGVLFSFAGIIFVLFWFGLETVIYSLILYWIGRLKRSEELLNPPMRVFGGEEYEIQIGRRRITTHRLLQWLMLVFVLIFGLCVFASYNQQYHWYPPFEAWFQTPSTIEKNLEKRIEELEAETQQLQQNKKGEKR